MNTIIFPIGHVSVKGNSSRWHETEFVHMLFVLVPETMPVKEFSSWMIIKLDMTTFSAKGSKEYFATIDEVLAWLKLTTQDENRIKKELLQLKHGQD